MHNLVQIHAQFPEHGDQDGVLILEMMQNHLDFLFRLDIHF